MLFKETKDLDKLRDEYAFYNDSYYSQSQYILNDKVKTYIQEYKKFSEKQLYLN